MKRILSLVLLLVSVATANAKCDWSGYWLKKVNQQQNVYTFRTNIDPDVCVDYLWIVYDHQLKRYDTVADMRGFTQVQFNVKGKYTVNLKAIDICQKCDTTFSYLVDMTIYKKADAVWSVGVKNCKYYQFEMTGFDTCVEYYYSIYKSDLFDSLYGYWDTASKLYEWLYKNYDFDEKDLVYYNMASQQKVTHEFADSGRHLLIAYWYNRCSLIDTFVMRKLEVCPSFPVLSTKAIRKEEPKLVGIYDMLGRPVRQARENEVLIYVYSDGTRRKMFLVKAQ